MVEAHLVDRAVDFVRRHPRLGHRTRHLQNLFRRRGVWVGRGWWWE